MRMRSVGQIFPQPLGPALQSSCHRDAATVELSSTALGAKHIEDKKAAVLPQVIIRERSRVKCQGIGKCYDNKETHEEGGEIFTT